MTPPIKLLCNRQNISTHTLTWSVTDLAELAGVEYDISTHTLTWSVTSPPIILHEHHGYFNSHAHVERDPWQICRFSPIQEFQLTRSRGAWRQPLKLELFQKAFQLTRSRGAWRVLRCHRRFYGHFNSHAHVERDITELKLFQLYVDFNSHAHVERDCFHFFASSISNISTHTLTWSVTILPFYCSTLF